MVYYIYQCEKCFHLQVCAQIMKNQLFIRNKMLKEENPKCEHFANADDVAPVWHGRWIIGDGDDDFDVKCSVCGWTDIFDVCGIGMVKFIAAEMHYCQNCGSKMDLGGDDNDL